MKKLGPLEFAPLGNLSLIDISFNPGVIVSEDAFRQLDNLRELGNGSVTTIYPKLKLVQQKMVQTEPIKIGANLCFALF